MKKTTSNSPAETRALAVEIARTLKAGSVIALHGQLGAGKTCFVQGLAEAFDCYNVTSPTYTLVNEYRGTMPIFHIDLYRIGSAQEALGFGLDEYLHGEGITVIEWAERASELLPDTTLHIHIDPGKDENERFISVADKQ